MNLPTTKAEWLDLFRTMVPDWYADALLGASDAPAVDSGGEVFHALAAIMARVALAAKRGLDDHFHLQASLGARSTGAVTLAADRVTGEVMLAADTRVRQPGGPLYRTTAAVTLPADETPVSVPVECLFEQYSEHPAGTITEVVLARYANGAPSYSGAGGPPADWVWGVKLVGSTATSGGRFPMLRVLGADRGLVPSEGESQAVFVERCRTLDDVVSPEAVRGHVDIMLRPLTNERCSTAELWRSGGWYFGHSYLGTDATGVMVRSGEHWRHFRLDLPTAPRADRYGFYFGRSYLGGEHYPGAWDAELRAWLRGLINTVNRVKGEGVPWLFTIAGWPA